MSQKNARGVPQWVAVTTAKEARNTFALSVPVVPMGREYTRFMAKMKKRDEKRGLK
jgi:hypothetical protein